MDPVIYRSKVLAFLKKAFKTTGYFADLRRKSGCGTFAFGNKGESPRQFVWEEAFLESDRESPLECDAGSAPKYSWGRLRDPFCWDRELAIPKYRWKIGVYRKVLVWINNGVKERAENKTMVSK